MPNPREVATLIVAGRKFDDWESVWVQCPWASEAPSFRFSAAERDPIPNLWSRLQFKPGDECAIYLGGELAVAGVILTRQTAYDANQHGVQLMGRGMTWYAARGSIVDKRNLDGKTFEQIAHEIIKPFGVGVKAIGTLNAMPFQRLQTEPTESVWTFLERIARARNIVLGSDHQGNFLLIGDHSFPISEQLVEGQNILHCQAIISAEYKRSEFYLQGQTAGSDSKQGIDASEQEAIVAGTAKRYSPLLQIAEQPVWDLAELKMRASAERQWNEGNELRVSITVQGWHNPRGLLWRAGAEYHVTSPMAMVNQVLKAETVTFTQDVNQGSLTVLDLVAPWLLNGKSEFNLELPNAPQDPSLQPQQPITGPAQQSEVPPDFME
jgi:prophage tail gpP-like protein